MVLRWCPNQLCNPRRFQISASSGVSAEGGATERARRRKPGTSGCTCPYCGKDATDAEFVDPKDHQATLDKIQWAVREDAGKWLHDLANDFNRRMVGRNSFISVKMTSEHRALPEPRPWREDLLRNIQCHVCGRNYGVYAIAFFCPDCWACNLSNHFERELALVISQIDIAESLQGQSKSELAFRLLGNAHEDVVTGFETYLKSAFWFVVNKRPGVRDKLSDTELKGNPFQNLDRAAKLFNKICVDLFAKLTNDQFEQLKIDFHKRHVVGHNLGLADERYAEVVEDTNIGETIPLLASEIEAFIRTCLIVIQTAELGIPEFNSPSAD
jgi:hypothetical protein